MNWPGLIFILLMVLALVVAYKISDLIDKFGKTPGL